MPEAAGDNVDRRILSAFFRQIDYSEVAKRRYTYNRLYQEALLSEEPGKGISFTNMLTLLAHYKLIHDGNALQ